MGSRAFVARSQKYYLDVTHPDANKGAVVKSLSRILAVPQSEIATIGDGANDVAMFEQSAFCIAMGNASPEVQAKADAVTDSNEERRLRQGHRALSAARSGGRERGRSSRFPRCLQALADASAAGCWPRQSEDRAVCRLPVGRIDAAAALRDAWRAPVIAISFPWPRTHWFWGDERFVPPDDPLSNYRMVREAMLSQAPVPAENIHPVPTTGLTPEAAAARYEADAAMPSMAPDGWRPDRPLFDVTLLGLGPDGHTASLFPGDAAWRSASAGSWPSSAPRPKRGSR